MSVRVSDSFGAVGDPALPMLHLALDPEYMTRRLSEVLNVSVLELQAIVVRRHKPRRRCLIEYQLTLTNEDRAVTSLSLLGKIRAKGLDRRSHNTQQALWQHEFGLQAKDRIGVPETCGILPELAMWLQRRVDGVSAMQRLTDSSGLELAEHISEAVCKLQSSGPPARRSHCMGDELSILHRQLMPVAEANPHWKERIQRVLASSERLGGSLPDPVFCPCHRDFYADNVIINGTWLYLIDLDLYCMADPALDIGNFIGHVTEFSLRHHGQPDALIKLEQTLAESFLARTSKVPRAAIHVYTTLTLVRHIAISQRIPERRKLTPPLIELCENRLGT